MEKMTQQAFVALQRSEAINAARSILEGTVDIIKGCQFLFYIWQIAEFPEDDDYWLLSQVARDFDGFSDPEDAVHRTQEDLAIVNYQKYHAIEYNQASIIQVCNGILEKYAPCDLYQSHLETNEASTFKTLVKVDELLEPLLQPFNFRLLTN